MKKFKKIKKIVLILILFLSITIKIHAETYTGDLTTINQNIKNYLANLGYNVDKGGTDYTFTGAGSKNIVWTNSVDGKAYRFQVNIKVTKDMSTKEFNDYSVEITGSARSILDGTEEEISSWQQAHRKDIPVDHTAGEIIEEANSFIEEGESSESGISEENLQKLSSTIYNILLVVGISLAVVIAAVLGLKFITGGVEAQVEVKKALIPYIAGCIVIFGAFIIWKVVVQILNTI